MADASIKARGASGIVERDLEQSRKLEFLQILRGFPIREEGLERLGREFAEDFGFDPDALFNNPDQTAIIGRAALKFRVPNLNTNPEGAVLDGRNAPAVAAGLGNGGLPI